MSSPEFAGASLIGTKVLVTGAGSGIGAGIATLLAAAGASVAVNDLDGGGAGETVDTITGAGGAALAVIGDVATPDGAASVVAEAAERLGGLSALANNVGIVRGGMLESLSPADWDLVVRVDLSSAFYVSQRALPLLRKHAGAAIVNTSSLTAVAPAPGAGAYNAAKAGLLSLTQHMAVEWGPLGIRVNAVGPGLVPGTKLTPSGGGDQELRDRRGAAMPLRRVGTPADVAGVVVFLLSGLAGYVTGQFITVDGGMGLALQTLLPS
jgi:3-oxoacyl-[acyl-carrier protein] reductase